MGVLEDSLQGRRRVLHTALQNPPARVPRRAALSVLRRQGHPSILLASLLSVLVLPPRPSDAEGMPEPACRSLRRAGVDTQQPSHKAPTASLTLLSEHHKRECDNLQSATWVVAHLLPSKKHRILEPLARALERLGMQVVLQPLHIDDERVPGSPGSCHVLLSHVKHLLGEEDHNPAARSTLEALERWEVSQIDIQYPSFYMLYN